MDQILDRKVIRRGLIYVFALSVLIILSIFIFTTGKGTIKGVLSFNCTYIPVLLIVTIARWLFDGQAFVVLSKHGSRRTVSLTRGAVIRLEGTLVSSVIPLLAGTVSTHTYLLHKEKLRWSESIAITILRSVIPMILFLINIPILFFVSGGYAEKNFFNQILRAVSIPIISIIVFFILVLVYPSILKKVIVFISDFMSRIKLINKNRMVNLTRKLLTEVDKFRKIILFFVIKKKFALFMAGFWIFAAFTMDYVTALLIVRGFGFSIPWIQALAVQALMKPIIYSAPSPGGAGIWELVALGFFSLYVPKYMLGFSVFLWRIFLSYLPLVAGMYFFYREFRADSAQQG